MKRLLIKDNDGIDTATRSNSEFPIQKSHLICNLKMDGKDSPNKQALEANK